MYPEEEMDEIRPGTSFYFECSLCNKLNGVTWDSPGRLQRATRFVVTCCHCGEPAGLRYQLGAASEIVSNQMDFSFRFRVAGKSPLSFRIRFTDAGFQESVCMICQERMAKAADVKALLQLLNVQNCPKMMIFDGKPTGLADSP
jgi:hypothetical protein